MENSWELFFAEKSRRRSRRLYHERLLKLGVLILIFGSLAAAAYLQVIGH